VYEISTVASPSDGSTIPRGCHSYRPLLGVWQPVLVVDEQGMKRRAVCKKCIMPCAADRVSRVFWRYQGVAEPTTVPKHCER